MALISRSFCAINRGDGPLVLVAAQLTVSPRGRRASWGGPFYFGGPSIVRGESSLRKGQLWPLEEWGLS